MSPTLSSVLDHQYYYLALSKIPNIGPITSKNLIRYTGAVENIFNLTHQEIEDIPFLKRSQKNALISKEYLDLAEKELKYIESHSIEIITIESEDYPYRLKLIDDSPLIIFKKGKAPLNPLRTVGIVGTRTSSIAGQRYCKSIVEGLQAYQATIISGLASGIDGFAHRHALDIGLNTIGVVAHGFQYRYPESNAPLFRKMQDEGAILTEYGFSVYASKDNFPRRNRIVAALSDALIVVESRERGGSLITANIANDYNKDVFAIPGRLQDQSFAGCNKLIKTHKAHLFQSVEDIAYILRWSTPSTSASVADHFPIEHLTDMEKKIINYLRVSNSAFFDDIAFHCSSDLSNLAASLLQLEFKNLISALPGNKYILNR